jgi:hypothetical protein
MQRSPPQEEQDIANNSITTPPQKEKKPKKPNNGWTKSLELLAANWADYAACYRWMHERTGTKLSKYNMYLTLPVIVLSTLTGTANFGIDSLMPDPSYTKIAISTIGGVSIFTGIISTVANFLRYAQTSEAHRVAGVSWGKFQRFVSIELALHPNERMDSMSFMKMGRVELDRLIEQSPTIPGYIIDEFISVFADNKTIRRPEIVGGLERTQIYDDSDTRLARIASDAALMLGHKKQYMRELLTQDFDKYIVEKTRIERENQENELMNEVVRAARDTTIATFNAKYKHIVNTVIPTGTINPTANAPSLYNGPRPHNVLYTYPNSPTAVELTPMQTPGIETPPSIDITDTKTIGATSTDSSTSHYLHLDISEK